MSLLFARKVVVCCCWSFLLAIPAAVFGQTNYYSANGTEYPIVGSLPGDQMFPNAALNSSGGFVVWQDNATDGNDWGVSAMKLDGTLSGSGSSFRVNVAGTNDQEKARVTLLKNGGAAFVWQGGVEGFQHIYARFLNASNTWLTPDDVPVNTMTTNIFYSYITNTTTTITTNFGGPGRRITGYTTNATTTVATTTSTNSSTANFQINPAIATLNDGDVIVVWASFNQAGANSMQDVYGQILSPTGAPIGTNFLINQFTSYNQRNPSVAALKDGGFVVAWVSEQERVAFNLGGINNTNGTSPSQIGLPSVDIFARLYQSNGVADGNEFLADADSNPCAYPAISVGSDGNFMIAWCARDMTNAENSWDIYTRPFSSTGSGGTITRVNSHLYGDQYVPRISSIGSDYLIVWTSLGQDGSREGVFGQFVHEDGSLVGGEFRVNTTTLSQQKEPLVASDGIDQFLVIWTSFTVSPSSFDLFAQRYANVSAVLEPMAAPFVWAPFTLSNNIYQPQLEVSWSPLLGISVSNYEVYVDGATTPMALTTTNIWVMTAANGLTNDSTHSFAVDYVTTDGRRSPISQSSTNTTWSGLNRGGIPYEWMAEFFGGYVNGKYTTTYWPSPNTSLGSGGLTLLKIFQSGGNPLDSSTWLQTALVNTPEGLFLTWNPQPGFTYQVQVTTDLTTWSNLGAPRFSAGDSDSIFVGGKPAGYYRVVLLHQ